MRPTVTVITTAYNAEQFVGEALASALGQTYPAELLDIVVVDDGSTDATAGIVASIAAESNGRVRLIRQDNAGNARAFNRGLEEARGELIAILDSDDAWHPEKIDCQVELIDDQPDVTLVYGDMTVIDADGATIEESWLDLIWAAAPPHGDRCAGPLLVANAATASSMLLRRSAISPIPDAIPMADWWLAIEAARRGPIEYLREPRTRYRMHDGNIGLGAEGDKLHAALRRRLAVQRWFLRHMPPGELSGDELLAIWDAFEHNAMAARRVGASAFEPLFDIAPGDRLECADAVAAAQRGNPLANAMHAVACIPWDPEARATLDEALGRTRPVPGPEVSALMVVYNGERFIAEAIESVLAQDYPADALELVVVDDGSTDSTPAILAGYVAAHPGRIRILRQANAGNTAATNTAMANARGEFLALIDADDVWPADKIRRQVELMRERPQVGLVYTDMHVIDAEGATVQASWLEGDDPPRGRCLGRLLAENPCTASSVMIRATTAEAIGPIPPELPFADWWLAANTARIADIGYLPEPRTLYRRHEDNMSLGTQGKTRARELGRAIRQSRWLLQRLEPGDASDAELWDAWLAFERNGHEAFGLLDDPFPGLIGATAEDRADAAALVDSADRALRRGAASEALLLSIRAAATHPWTSSARLGVAGAYSATAAGAALPGQTPLAGTLPYVVRVPIDELDDVLGSYVAAMADVPGVTLAIDASLMAPAAGEAEMARLAAGVPLDAVDAVAVLGPLDEIGRARLLCGTRAVLTSGAPDPDALPPVLDVAGLAALRGGRVRLPRAAATLSPRFRRGRVPRLAAALGAALVGFFSAGGAAQQPADDDDPAVTVSDREQDA